MTARGGRSGGRGFCFGVEAFDAARKAVFLEALGRTANVTRSAKAAGVAANTAYRHRRRYPAFRAAWAVALEHGLAGIERALFEDCVCPGEAGLGSCLRRSTSHVVRGMGAGVEGGASRLRQAQPEREHSAAAKARGDMVRLMKAHGRGFGMEQGFGMEACGG